MRALALLALGFLGPMALLAACGGPAETPVAPDEALASATPSASVSAVASASASASASAPVAPIEPPTGEPWTGPNVDEKGRSKLTLRQVADARRRHKDVDDNPLLDSVVEELGEPQLRRGTALVWYGIEERSGEAKADGSAGPPVKICMELELTVENGRITNTALRKFGSSESLHSPRLAKDAWKLCGEIK